MASCDIVFASTNAKFSPPEVKVGVLGGTRHLRRLVPDKVVRYMALTGNLVDAAYFKQIGVIQDVVPLEDRALAYKPLCHHHRPFRATVQSNKVYLPRMSPSPFANIVARQINAMR